MDNSTPNSANNQGIVNIHGKEYMTVARRVVDAHTDNTEKFSITTELLSTTNGIIVFKATVVSKKGTFTGTSAVDVNNGKSIEKNNPYEVAETSAVGRALGFAGYGVVESIASADEMVKSGASNSEAPKVEVKEVTCEACGKPATERKGITKGGKEYHGIFCSTDDRSHTRWLWN